MNCQSIRQQILIDPYHLNDNAQRHIDACAECRATLESALHNDQLMREAFASKPPPGLQERIEAEASFTTSRRRLGMGIAASIAAIGMAGTGWLLSHQWSSDPWVEAMIAHFGKDPQHLFPADPNAGQQFDQVLAKLGGKQTSKLPPVVRADSCLLRQKTAGHIVFEINDARAVAFFLQQHVTPTTFTAAEWQGEVLAVPGGSVGILGGSRCLVSDLSKIIVKGIELDVA